MINWAQFFLGEKYFQSCILFASFFNFPIVQWTKSKFKIRHLLGLVIMLIGSITSHIIWTHDPPAASYTHTGMSNSLRPKVTKTFQCKRYSKTQSWWESILFNTCIDKYENILAKLRRSALCEGSDTLTE